MTQIDEDAEAVELIDQLSAEIGEPAIITLVAAAADAVGGVVRELDDAQPELPIDLHHRQIITESAGILPSEDDAGLAFPLAALDVGSRINLPYLFRVLPEPGLPIGDRPHARGEILPYAARAIGRGDATGAQSAKYLGAPIGDNQAINDHCVIV